MSPTESASLLVLPFLRVFSYQNLRPEVRRIQGDRDRLGQKMRGQV